MVMTIITLMTITILTMVIRMMRKTLAAKQVWAKSMLKRGGNVRGSTSTWGLQIVWLRFNMVILVNDIIGWVIIMATTTLHVNLGQERQELLLGGDRSCNLENVYEHEHENPVNN